MNCGHGDQKKREAEIRVRLERLGEWFIEEGAAIYYRSASSDHVIDEAVKVEPEMMYINPAIRKNNYGVLEFSAFIEPLQVVASIIFQQKCEDSILEYCLVRVFASDILDGMGQYKRTHTFIIAQTASTSGARSILATSHSFIESHAVSAGCSIAFPFDDVSMASSLYSWWNPAAFTGSPLENLILDMDETSNKQIMRQMTPSEKDLFSRP